MKLNLKDILFSTRLMAVLFFVFGAALAVGTFIESMYSTETARIWIYNARWFEAIMVFFVINFMGNMFRYRLFRREKWPVLVLHLSWIIIILGAFVTRYISFEGVMPIREGNTENVFYSDKTYLTVNVIGEIDGNKLQKNLEDDLIVTPEAIKSTLPWTNDFNGQPFSIAYAGFIDGAKEGLLPDPKGKEYLKIVEAGDGNRHDHYLESGEVVSIHNILFALNKLTEGAINITTTDSTYYLQTPFEGNFMRMADQFQGTVVKDSVAELQLRSVYNMAKMQFVIPDRLLRGSYGVVEIPKDERTENDQNALVVNVTVNEETIQKKLLGGKGSSEITEFEFGGLAFAMRYGSKVYTLPFHMKLGDFIAEKYPGTDKGYASFMSKVTVEEEGKASFDYDIYMNNVLDHQGYRFFQSSFDPDEKGTILSVNHDFWGTWITYIGYFLLYIGLMGILFFGKTRFRDLEKALDKLKKQKASLSLILCITFGVAAAQEEHPHNTLPTDDEVNSMIEATIVSKEHAAKFGELIVQDAGGRMKPINTFSSELLRKLSRSDSFKGMNADQVFLSMMLNPPAWYNTRFIALEKQGKNDSLRKILNIPDGEKYAKATDFFEFEKGYKLEPFLRKAYATNTPTQHQKDFKDVDLRLSLLDRALSGQITKIFPLPNDENNKWISPLEYRSGEFPVTDSLYANFISNGIPYYLISLRKSIESGDYAESNSLLEAFLQNQKNKGAEVLPSEAVIKTEIIYNKLNIFNRLYTYYALAGVLMFFVLIFAIYKDREIWRIAIFCLKGVIILLFLWHTAGLVLRWYISGHAPWSNAYESILYVSWSTMGIGLAFGRKSNMTIAATAFVSCMLLWVAHGNWVDPSIGNLVPVLDSYWLMIHVAVIVGSYGPLTVGFILGVVVLILMMLTTARNKARMEINIKELTIVNEMALTIGLVMLTIGNFLGGQWANESWGRYWGWDPKETWALVSIMVYAFVIHMRLVPKLRGKWTFNMGSVIAYGSIMMTYFGVNYYLVGLHSYGQSGSAAITPDFVKYIVLGVVLLGTFSYLRYRKNYLQTPRSTL